MRLTTSFLDAVSIVSGSLSKVSGRTSTSWPFTQVRVGSATTALLNLCLHGSRTARRHCDISCRGRRGTEQGCLRPRTAAAPATADSTVAPAGIEAAASKYKVLKHLKYSGPGKLSLRLGYYDRSRDKGFGWLKVRDKHNITKYSAVEFVAQSPTREHVSAKKYHLHAWANKLRCRNGSVSLRRGKKSGSVWTSVSPRASVRNSESSRCSASAGRESVRTG